MQTFNPYPDLEKSAAALDTARLRKQILEIIQILTAVTGVEGFDRIPNSVRSHPCTQSWSRSPEALLAFGWECLTAYAGRATKTGPTRTGVFHESLSRFGRKTQNYCMPAWWGDRAYHAGHRHRLYAKDPIHYAQFAGSDATPLWYPVLDLSKDGYHLELRGECRRYALLANQSVVRAAERLPELDG